MAKNEPIFEGEATWLCINGQEVDHIKFCPDGPFGDVHRGYTRPLSNHDGAYLRTSGLKKGEFVFNHRQWSAISQEDMADVSLKLGIEKIPRGCLLENIGFSGIPNFSDLPLQCRINFVKRAAYPDNRQAVLWVTEKNDPCVTVGNRLADQYKRPELTAAFVEAALGIRGVVGFVYSAGIAMRGDKVIIYPPVE